MLGKIEDKRRRGQQRMRWLGSITDWMDMSLCRLRNWLWTGKPGVLQSVGMQRVGHDWANEMNWLNIHVCVDAKLFQFVDSLWPYGLWPTRLLCPWDSPDKNTGVSCYALLQGIFWSWGWRCISWVSCIGRCVLYHWATWEALTGFILQHNIKILNICISEQPKKKKKLTTVFPFMVTIQSSF